MRGRSSRGFGLKGDSAASAGECCPMGREFRWRVISSYIGILKRSSSPVGKECQLPFPKNVIRRAILKELSQNPDPDMRSYLEVAYAQLETFLPSEEFQAIEEFKLASSLAQEMAKSGDPGDIIASARIIERAGGERAVRIEEKISEKMKRRLAQIRSLGMSVMAFDACTCSLEY